MSSLEHRIDTLERELNRVRGQMRIARRIAGIALASTAVIVTIAATTESNVADVIRAKRFEVLNDDARPVTIIASRGGSGALDLYSSEGRNIMGLSVNDSGGDLAIWTRTGVSAFGAYATAQGGAANVFNRDGKPVFSTRASADACGRLDLANVNGNAVFSIEGQPDTGVSLALFNQAGTKVVALGTPSPGALLNMMTGDGNVVLVAGAADDGTGAAVTLKNDFGKPIVHAGVGASQGGIVTALDQNGANGGWLTPARPAPAPPTPTRNTRR